MSIMVKKLIEVALPLEKINAEAAREKSIRHGHPSTLHLWWARRPLATARAVIWSSLVDDPSSHPEQFPTEEEQNKERQRLFRILEKLVEWENSNDEEVLNAAKAEIMKSTGGNPPALLDPFAGGGAIPLEAQRLGLEAHAHDLNPVAVMINKAMIEIPPRFSGMSPVNPEDQKSLGGNTGWKGAAGLAADVRYYGEWMKQEAFKRIGHLYPTVKDEQGRDRTVIAWIWARTVKCPNPACGCEMPLASSFDVSKKKGNEAWIHPEYDAETKKIRYVVKHGKNTENISPKLSRGAKFKCIICNETATDDYIKSCANEGRMGSELLCVLAEGERGRIFISPNDEQLIVSDSAKPEDYPTQELPYDPRNIWCVNYGLNTYDKLFTKRQLTALSTLSSLVSEAQMIAEKDALSAGLPDDGISLSEGGCGAKAYGEAVGVFLAFAVDRESNYCSTLNGWSGEFIIQVFGRQSLPMVWDYAESNPFSNSTGNWSGALNWIERVINNLPATGSGSARQFDAQSNCGLNEVMISTDPPYYDNISYADLSDYFYVWLRKSIKGIYPKLFRTMLVPKAEELIATPYRFDGDKQKAKEFFEAGMSHACENIRLYARDDYPITIYYAYKQSDTNNNQTASTGWETMLSAIIKAGMSITGTWPMHTERETGLKASVNALASSIVLVCRKRPESAQSTTHRGFVNELRRELRSALSKLQSSNIAPVDLAQSAIGPGIGVFSKYKQVLEADGTPMTVRTALQIINQELDVFFNEQDGVLDRESRFCVDLFTQYAFGEMKFGEADTLARAKNTSVDTMKAQGILHAEKGIVRLLTRDEIPMEVRSHDKRSTWLLMQQLTHALETKGIMECANFVFEADASQAEYAKSLAYRLYTICERKGWNQEAYAYNNLVVAWPEIQSAAADIRATVPHQYSFFDEEE